MIHIWPTDLPRPERNTWQARPQDARRKRQNEAGPPSYRRRFSSVAKLISLSVVLTRNQKAVFDRFFHEDCADGSEFFYMPDPTTDGWALLTESGQPIFVEPGVPLLLSERWLCAWGDDLPTETVEGIEFRKAFNVVVMP